jgi:uncharacterized protein (DUF488 family)
MSQIPIFTIGYGARDIEAFVDALKQYQIDYLIDVRSKPYSRYKPEFSKQSLEEELIASEIRYVFMGDALGGRPDDPSCYDESGKVDYDRCRQRPQFLAGIGRLRTAHDQQLRVALMCSESKPEMCHRSKLIGEVLSADGVDVQHIDENDSLLSHKQVMLRVQKGQPSLFGDEFFHHRSRKSYKQSEDESD